MSSVSNVTEFIHNRAQFPAAQLAAYDGKWVAFSSDGQKIVASAKELDDIDPAITNAGYDVEDVYLERIVLDDDTVIGGAELH